MVKVHETGVCRILAIRQQRTVTPERSNEGSSGGVPPYCLERGPRLDCREQDLVGPVGSLNGGDGSRIQRAQDGQRPPTGCPGGEVCPERTPRLTQPLPSSAHLRTSQCRRLGTAPGQGRSHRRTQGNGFHRPHRARY